MSICLYLHGGSKNHGCEALVRTTCKIVGGNINVFSYRPEDDIQYGIDKICHLEPNGYALKKYSLKHIIAKVRRILTGSKDSYFKHVFSNLIKNKAEICLSIGGDNYCYGDFPKTLAYINRQLNKKKAKTVLWGCSIEPALLSETDIVKDLNRYSLITARDSITYNALKSAGVTTSIKLYPDPAFQLNKVELPLPESFIQGNTIGINISPLIIHYEENSGMTLRAYETLLKHIIDTTNMQIALIPHVIRETSDDRKPLQKLYNEFRPSGRVVMIEDYNCMELKGFIARCRFFIGARTHATIAAYSTCVPTLVVGYSVKAKGIAKDIFGTYENYVIPVQSLENMNDLITAFEWIKEHEDEIRTHLREFMPGYIEKSGLAGEEIRKLM